MRSLLLVVCASLFLASAQAQPDRWQQRIRYNIEAELNVQTNRMKGTERMEYTNNSPDTLHRLFIHLYWNAFQPNSSMDVRSRELGKIMLKNRRGEDVADWDARVRDRISRLGDSSIGYQKVAYVKVNGKDQQLREWETILEIKLDKPVLPKAKAMIELAFEAQVPAQIRRSGRDNAEGVRYSMAQWYPKMVEYDYQGWNANPYIAREFYGVWGDYEVKLTLDKTYMVAATGVLQNANSIGFGYEAPGTKLPAVSGNNLTWHFKGENIHDFVWAADPAYKHISKKIRPDLTIHAFYKAGDARQDSAWNNVLWAAEKVLPYMEQRFGKYPYPQYSFIQGGDGGMEYAMATLLKGSGLGTVIHEWMHSWYQHMMGTNESLFAWMDEGFTDYGTNEVSDYFNQNWAAKSPWINEQTRQFYIRQVETAKTALPLKQAGSYNSYFNLAKSGFEEPMTTHADHFNTNYAYSTAAYSKGAVFIAQLGYIVGDSVRDRILLEYYNQWRFKHPNVNDFVRVAEKVSGLTLQWYKEYFVYTTKTIDYAVGDMTVDGNKTNIALRRTGKMPMPIDVTITFKDGSTEHHYIPLNLLYGEKPAEAGARNRVVHPEWKWTHPEYVFSTTRALSDIKSVEIDATGRMADINRANNKIVIPD